MAPPFPSPTKKWHDNTYESLSPTRPELSAKGKSVFITGGGTGIGAETARYFALAGASRIGLLGRREQPLLDTKASIEKELGSHSSSVPEIMTFSADVTKKEQVDDAFAKFTAARVGGDGAKNTVDVLISNAAVLGPLEGIATTDPEGFGKAVGMNVVGALLVAQAFARHMVRDGSAVAVNVSSALAFLSFGDSVVAYSAAKMGSFRVWDALAFATPELAVFHIQPGIVDTAMDKITGGIAAVGFQDHVSLPASFMVWLASPESRFLRGKFLFSNWDVDELKARREEIEGRPEFNLSLVGWPWEDKSYKLDKLGWLPETSK